MPENTPEHSSYATHEPLKRFEADMYYAQSFYDIYNGFTNYLALQFDISEAVTALLYRDVSLQMPDADFYEEAPSHAVAQARLGLIRIALPLAENLIEDDADFAQWVRRATKIAMGLEHDEHTIDDCVSFRGGVNELSCRVSHNCPVKVVKHILIVDSARPYFAMLDYQEPWAAQKITRTLAKLKVAEDYKLTESIEAYAIRNSYVSRTKAHGLRMPDRDDI